MRLVLGKLFTFCWISSMLLCLAATGLWVRSYLEWDEARLSRIASSPGDARTWAAWSKNGVISVGTHQWHKRRSDGSNWAWTSSELQRFEERSGYNHWPAPSSPAGEIDRSFWFRRSDGTNPKFDHDDPDWEERWAANRPHGTCHIYGWNLWMPHWSLSLGFGLMPAVRLGMLVRHRMKPKGLCPACGYDIRATQERCPECGANVAAANDRQV